MTNFRPNMTLRSPDGDEIVIGLILRHANGRLFGLTSKGTIDRLDANSFVSSDNQIKASLSADSQQFLPTASLRNLMVLLDLNKTSSTINRIDFGAFWPRNAAENDALLGCAAVKIIGDGTAIKTNPFGTVSEILTEATPQMGQKPRWQQSKVFEFGELLVLTPFHLDEIDNLRGGTLLISPLGQAIGIVIGKTDRELILCSIGSIILGSELDVFVPFGAHWRALPFLSSSFDRLTTVGSLRALNELPTMGILRRKDRRS